MAGRPCTVCQHDETHPINVAIVQGESNRSVARTYGFSENAVRRHRREHIPQLLVKSKQAVESANADDLIRQVKGLQGKTIGLLNRAEQSGELRTALAAIREARGNVELLAKLLKLIADGQTVNLYSSPQWVELRGVIVQALAPYPEARGSVLRALGAAANGGRGGS